MLNFMFTLQAFSGSSGSKTTRHIISRPFIARKIRIVVKSWYQYPCLRIELFYKGKYFRSSLFCIVILIKFPMQSFVALRC